MNFRLRFIPTAIALAALVACGGGGGGGSGGTTASFSGTAVDGYLSFAKIVCDANENGVADSTESIAYTDTVGKFVFASGCTHSLLASGGTNSDTGLGFVGQMRAPAGSKFISPLTTLLAAGLTQAQVNTALNLPANTDVTSVDPAAVDASGNLTNATLYKKTLAVQQLLQKTAEMLTGLGNSAGTATTMAMYTQTAAAFASVLKTSSPLLTSDTTSDTSVVNAMVKAAVSTVASSTAATSSAINAIAVDGTVVSTVAAASPTAVAAVTAPAYKYEVDTILGASGNATSVASTVTAKQSSTFVADFVTQNRTLLATATNTSATVLASLGATVASSDAAGINTLDTILATFDESTPLVVGGFGGNQAFTGIVALTSGIPTGSSSGKVLQITRTDASKGGTTYDGGYTNVESSFTGASTQTISALVYSPSAGVPIKMHLDKASLATGGASAQATADISSNETVVQGWQTLTWTFSGLNTGKVYDFVVLTPNNGTVAPSGGENYYFDQIKLKSSADPIVASNYLTLTNDSMTLVNNTATTKFTLADFQSSTGISTGWPLSSSATLSFKLSEVGNFTLAAGQKLSAAIEISETGSGQGLLQGFIENVAVSKSGKNVTITVPSTSNAKTYGLTSAGTFRAIVDFNSDVSGVTSTLTADDVNGNNTLNLGNVLNYTTTSLSNQFTGISALRGKYKVKIVINGLPLRQAGGVIFTNMTVNVPTALNADKSIKTTTPVTGPGIVGYITLTN